MPKATVTSTTSARAAPVNTITRPSRRNLLGGSSAALLAGVAAAVAAHGAEFQKPGPLPWRGSPRPAEPVSGEDAELIALCAALARQHALVDAIQEEGHHLPPDITPASEAQERRLDAAPDDWWATAERIEATPARTAGGLRAKAEAMRLVLLRLVCCHPGDTIEYIAESEMEDRMAWSLARDILAGAAA